MSSEATLLYNIFKQTLLDYIKLDPDSDCMSADYFESEGEDYKTAEDIIFNNVPIYYGTMVFYFDDLVDLFQNTIGLTSRQLKKRISRKVIEY